MQENINTQLLDEELGKLKSIGLKELSKTTKLASSKIEDVLEKHFDKIDRVRAKGFIAILEREYGVDLRDWLLLQEQLQRGGDVKSVAEVISKQDAQERTQKLAENAMIVQEKEEEKKKDLQKNKPNPVIELALSNQPTSKSHAESYSWLYVIVGVMLFVLIGYFAYKAFVQDNHSAHPIESSATQGANDGHYDGVFFDTTKPLEGGEQAAQNAQHSQEVSQPEAESPASSQDSNAQIQNKQANNHPEQDFFFNPKPATDTASQANTQGKQQVNDNVLHIQAEQDLWLGVINLETGSKEQFAYKKEYDIPLDNKMLFVMGHSVFKLTLNGEEIPHGSKHPVRMYYDGSSLVDVNYARFKQLNGGSEW